MKNHKVLFLILLLLIIVIAGAVYGSRLFSRNQFLKVSPSKGEIIEAVYGLGRVKSNARFDVKIGVLSTVQKIYAHEGDEVKKNQKLIGLEPDIVFLAPFEGVVTMVSVYAGETALPQSTLLRLEDITDRFIELSVEQEAALRIRKGQTAKVSFESLRGEILEGHVSSIYPKNDEFIVTVYIKSLHDSVLPGMSADVSIEVGRVTGTLVPLKSIRNGLITLERDGRIRKLKVEVGLVDSLSAQIKGDSVKLTDFVLVPRE